MLRCVWTTSTIFSPENQRGANTKKRAIMTAATNPITKKMSVAAPSRESPVMGLLGMTSLHIPVYVKPIRKPQGSYGGAMPRHFPPPWTVEQIPGGYKVKDANGQALAYVYARETRADADIAKVLTMDEARRIASNIAKATGGTARRDERVGTGFSRRRRLVALGFGRRSFFPLRETAVFAGRVLP